MLFRKLLLVSAISFPLILTGCGDDGDDGAQGPVGAQGPAGPEGPGVAPTTIALSLMGRYETGEFDESAAEIVDYNPATQEAFVVNANSGKVDVVDAASPFTPALNKSLDVASDVAGATGLSAGDLGAANSVAIHNGLVAVAIEANPKQDNGYIAFYQTNGTFIGAVQAGALPDMVTFTHDGTKVLSANEGEPNGDYSIDPEGSITIVDVSGDIASLSAADVTQVSLAGVSLIGPVRISSKSSSVAADLEPEYITVSPDSTTAYVSMQENNAIGILDLATKTLTKVQALGFKDYAIPGNEIDASNKDDGINIRNWPIYGTYMPDSIAAFEFNGVPYVVTANEGDGREYLTEAENEADCSAQGGFDFDGGDCFHYLDEIRIKDIADTGASFDADLLDRLGADFDKDENLGRIKIVANLGVSGTCASLATTGQPGPDCIYENLYSFGARSITVWNMQTGQPVFDSGSDFEVITANRLGDNFNASNDDNEGDDRSDDKGPEPEGIELGVINGKTYAFIGLERVGGVMVYNISNPEAAEFVQYINPRDFTIADVESDLALVGDLGPEGLKFVSGDDSPTGKPMLIVANEVSGTTSFFDIEIVVE